MQPSRALINRGEETRPGSEMRVVSASVGATRNYADERDRNASLCDPLAPTIFHEEWWLNAATSGDFDVAEISVGGRTVGRLPFHMRKRFGLRMIRMPEMTHFLGPAIDEGEGSPNNRFLKRLEITRQLIARLPRASSRYLKCHAGVTDVIAFQEHGFETHVQFTHTVAPQAVDTLWSHFRNKTRNVIRRAKEQLTIRELSDPCEFVQLYERNLESKDIQNAIDSSLCREIIAASLDRHRGRILAAFDGSNRVIAANFCAWDHASTYYLLSTRRGDSGNGAVSLLIWEAMKDSTRRGLTFDFAGLGTKGSILFYTGFGGAICPRYVALSTGVLARLVREAKSLLVPENFFY